MKLSIGLLTRLIRKASKSECKFLVAALGFNKSGKCIQSSVNISRYSKEGGGIHAEEFIMKGAKKKGIEYIVVCRVGKSGDFRAISPCKRCSKIATKLGIKIYSIMQHTPIKAKNIPPIK